MVLTCASSSVVSAASRRRARRRGAAARARPLQLLAQPQLQLAGGLLGERDRDDLVDARRGPREDARRCGRPARWSCRCRRRPRRRACRRARSRSACARVVASVLRNGDLVDHVMASPERVEVGERVRRLAAHARCSSRAAHRAEIAPRRSALAGAAARKPSSIARSMISSTSSPARAVRLVERNLVIGEPAGGVQ